MTWTPGMADTFYHIKEAVASASELVIPVCGDCFVLRTDASSWGVGTTLNVVRDGAEHTTEFFSRQLQGAQKYYSATDM